MEQEMEMATEKTLEDLVEGVAESRPLPIADLAAASEALPAEPQQKPRIRVPARHNAKLDEIVQRINQDEELWTLWQCANVNAVDRLGLTDHGWVHVQIVANVGLKLLRLLIDAGITPSVVANHGLANADAEVVVAVAGLLHDIGISVHREDHERLSTVLAPAKLKELLGGLYDVQQRTIVNSEILHAIYAHRWDVRCLNIEAGVVKVADALDMSKGRSRIPFEAGAINIHSLSALSIEGVTLRKGQNKPIRVEVAMSNSAGIFQLDELLRRKLEHSSIAKYVEVTACISGQTEAKLVDVYQI